MLFLDELAQEKDIEEVSLWLAEVLYAFLQSEISKSGPKIDLVNIRWVFYSRAYGNLLQKKALHLVICLSLAYTTYFKDISNSSTKRYPALWNTANYSDHPNKSIYCQKGPQGYSDVELRKWGIWSYPLWEQLLQFSACILEWLGPTRAKTI